MKTLRTSTLHGANVYAATSVIRHTVTLEEERQDLNKTVDTATLTEIFRYMPTLEKSLCKKDLSVRHLFEHICIELQNMTGANLVCSSLKERNELFSQDLVFPYEEEAIGHQCSQLALDILNKLVLGKSSAQQIPAASADIKEKLHDFTNFASDLSMRVQDRAVMQAAASRNIPVIRRADRLFQLGYGHLQKRMSATKTSCTDVISNDIAANKDYSRRIVSELGLPVPRYERVRSAKEAVEAAEKIGYPVVVKPNNGGMGRGVSIGMKNAKAVREAYKLARRWGRSCLVEEFVPGSDFRLLVINNQLIAASQRVPAHVKGDGKRTIAELVKQTNLDPRRGPGQEFPWTRLQLDDKADRLLQELGYTHETIPKKGEVVFLRRNANTSDGGTAADITDKVHPDNREIAEKAVQAIGLDIAGVDLLTTDITKSMRETKGCICEINSRPGLRKHMWPAEGTARDVTGPIIEMLIPSGSDGRIPIVTLLNSGQPRSCANMLFHILDISGQTVGVATPDGVTINNYRHGESSVTGRNAIQRILLDPGVQIAVIEVSPEDVLQSGLGYDSCTVGAFFNHQKSVSPSANNTDSVLLHEANKVISSASQHKVIFAHDLINGPAVLSETHPDDLTVVSLRSRNSLDPDLFAASFRTVSLETLAGRVAIVINNRDQQPLAIPLRGALALSIKNPELASELLMTVALATTLDIDTASIMKGIYCFPGH